MPHLLLIPLLNIRIYSTWIVLCTSTYAGKKWRLGENPAPDMYHHLVEDFLTDWTNREDHILLLRRFIEGALHTDLRSFFTESCFEVWVRNMHIDIHYQSKKMFRVV